MATGTIPMNHSTLLWTNPNPTSSFAAQTIDVSCEGFAALVIQYYAYAGNSGVSDAVISLDSAHSHFAFAIATPATGAATVYGRSFTPYGTAGIVVTDGVKKEMPNGSRATDNAAFVPYKIYGIK